MKKLLVIFVLLTAGMAFVQEVKAQFAGPIVRKGANLVDQKGQILSEESIIGLVGEDIYKETVVGARRQMKSGTGLIIGGSVVMGASAVFAVCGAMVGSNKDIFSSDSTKAKAAQGDALTAGALYLCAAALSSVGTLALGGGIALRAIGKGRIGWVAEQCNVRHSATLEWSASPAGAGIVMRF